MPAPIFANSVQVSSPTPAHPHSEPPLPCESSHSRLSSSCAAPPYPQLSPHLLPPLSLEWVDGEGRLVSSPVGSSWWDTIISVLLSGQQHKMTRQEPVRPGAGRAGWMSPLKEEHPMAQHLMVPPQMASKVSVPRGHAATQDPCSMH